MEVDVVNHYDASSATYSDQYDPSRLRTLEDYPANYFRLQMVIQRLAATQSKSVFEFGVGDGSPIAAAADLGLKVAGCDISGPMLASAREKLASRGLDPNVLRVGDIQDVLTLGTQIGTGPYDAVMALGVLPHVRDERAAIRNMSLFLKQGGRLFLSFRNSFLSLFSFNRLTLDFVANELLQGVSDSVKNAVIEEITPRLAMDLPPVRKGTPEAPGYDTILAKFHNPLELAELVEDEGFSEVRFHWYHYHPAPPMLAKILGASFREAAFDLEQSDSWRGMFLCSAGVIEAVKSS